MRNIKCKVLKPFGGRKTGDAVLLNVVEFKALNATGHVSLLDDQPQRQSYMTRDMVADPPGGVNASESVAEYARELGVDLSKVEGTGKDGRILKSDIRSILNDGE